nr:VPg protein [Grapevine chrome mosaic virus]
AHSVYSADGGDRGYRSRNIPINHRYSYAR